MGNHLAVATVLLLAAVGCDFENASGQGQPMTDGMGAIAPPHGEKNACNLESELRRVAVVGAIDCGHVALEADSTSADACLAAALGNGQAFQVRYEQQGIDSHVVFAAASPGGGVVTVLRYDGNLGFAPGDDHSVIYAIACKGPRANPAPRQPGDWPVECASTGMSLQLCQWRRQR